MSARASIRELRNNFPRVRRLVETEGEVLVTEQGTPKYRLTRYTAARKKTAAPKDYLGRLRQRQPKPMSRKAARSLHDTNRGDR